MLKMGLLKVLGQGRKECISYELQHLQDVELIEKLCINRYCWHMKWNNTDFTQNKPNKKEPRYVFDFIRTEHLFYEDV